MSRICNDHPPIRTSSESQALRRANTGAALQLGQRAKALDLASRLVPRALAWITLLACWPAVASRAQGQNAHPTQHVEGASTARTTEPQATVQPAKAPPESAAQTTARIAYARGVEAFSDQDYALAQEQFALAQRAYPSPNIELMLGRSLVKLGRLSEAYRVLQLAQAQGGTAKYARTAAMAADEVAALRPQLVRIELDVSAEHGDERVIVNGAPIARSAWDEPLFVDAGPVMLELSRPGVPAAVERLDLAPGATAHVTLALPEPRQMREPLSSAMHDEATASPAAARVQRGPATREATSSARSPWLQGLGYALGGVGAAAVVAFGVFGALSHARYAKLEELCPDGDLCHPAYRPLATSGRTFQTLANISLIAGGAALAGAGTLWIVSFTGGSAQVDIGASSVTLHGSF